MKNYFQRLGRSMLVPIVAMPMAGILIRLTAGDMLNIPVFQAAGTIFGNMDVILAVGIAMGMTHTKDRGIPALTGLLSIFVLKEGLKILDPSLNMSV
ncbi:MAG TPA: PTS acetylglucosamine transporter subunit IIB, partial [Erysipelotrichaceae bacterium]|nr:PTS acetylglucosamine transporter subunit IIB [Erysipelotrichaceae bacterium]